MIPEHPKDMSLDWLCEKLGGSKGALKGFDYAPIGTGQVGDSYRLTLTWDPHQENLPSSIVVKCPAQDTKSRETGRMLHNYEVEVRWYQEFARTAKIKNRIAYILFSVFVFFLVVPASCQTASSFWLSARLNFRPVF